MKLKLSQIIRISIAILCMIIFLILMCISKSLSKSLLSQQAAERWQSEIKSAQISVFFNSESEFSTADISLLHENIDEELTSKSLKAETKNSRLWYDAYSTQAGQLEISGTREKPANALATAVGGDFFLIHPMKLVSGGYFSEQDLMHDRVIIDTQLAWELFGSSDASGMTVIIQNKECLISGVVQPEEDKASKTAYGTMPRIYISYPFYEQNWNLKTTHISCYEAVLPNHVKGFAQTMLTKLLDLKASSSVILKNTDRFSLSGRWETLRNLKKLLTCEIVTYPYWENSARIVSYDTAILLLFEIISLIYPIIYFIFLICKAYLLTDRKIKETLWKRKHHEKSEA